MSRFYELPEEGVSVARRYEHFIVLAYHLAGLKERRGIRLVTRQIAVMIALHYWRQDHRELQNRKFIRTLVRNVILSEIENKLHIVIISLDLYCIGYVPFWGNLISCSERRPLILFRTFPCKYFLVAILKKILFIAYRFNTKRH